MAPVDSLAIQALVARLEPGDKRDLLAYLTQFLTPRKQTRLAQVLAARTRHLTVVLENIYHPHNASAVVRSCEIFGVQDVHVIEKDYEFLPNTDVVAGAARWVTLHRYDGPAERRTVDTLAALRAKGYQLAATTLRPGAVPLPEAPLERPLALIFGAEEMGVSDEAHALADFWLHIPMLGFTQSFNISVSAALVLADLRRRLDASDIDSALPPDEALDLQLEWSVKSVREGLMIAEAYLDGRLT